MNLITVEQNALAAAGQPIERPILTSSYAALRRSFGGHRFATGDAAGNLDGGSVLGALDDYASCCDEPGGAKTTIHLPQQRITIDIAVTSDPEFAGSMRDVRDLRGTFFSFGCSATITRLSDTEADREFDRATYRWESPAEAPTAREAASACIYAIARALAGCCDGCGSAPDGGLLAEIDGRFLCSLCAPSPGAAPLYEFGSVTWVYGDAPVIVRSRK